MLINIILVLFSITANSAADDVQGFTQNIPNNNDDFSSSSSSSSERGLQGSDLTGVDGSCHLSVSTKSVTETIVGNGIVLPIQSEFEDEIGLTITSFGFHVDLDELRRVGGTLGYEVYALKKEGYSADPVRNEITGELNDPDFDYRGPNKLIDLWEKLVEGNIIESDLVASSLTSSIIGETDFFQIPLGSFRYSVPPNGGIRSFYITTLDNSGFIYSNADGDVNVEMTLLPDQRGPGEYAPRILVGEGVLGYPMPDGELMYQPNSFLGKVYYEKECASNAPSLSAAPSLAPTIPLSDSPSFYPTLTLVPTNAPSAIPSEMPSLLPSLSPTITFHKMSGGILLSLPMDCEPGTEFPVEESAHLVESVKAVASRGLKKENKYIENVEATVIAVFCIAGAEERRLVRNSVHKKTKFNRKHRYLPTGSSALDFSLIVTGEYRPPSRAGQPPAPPLRNFDLGKIAEDSINRDPVGFVKDLKDRAEAANPFNPSAFAEVEPTELKVTAFDVPDDVDVTKMSATDRFTLPPTLRPTLPPPVILSEGDGSSTNSILLICVIVTVGLIATLGAFLLFRQGERRAAKTRREKMNELEEKKLKSREEKRQKAQWEEANMNRRAGGRNDDVHEDMMMKDPPHQYVKSMGYGHQPPPPNYYAGGPPPQNYSYGGPQNYGGPNNGQGHSYPPLPSMQGSDYGSRKAESAARGT